MNYIDENKGFNFIMTRSSNKIQKKKKHKFNHYQSHSPL